MRRLLKPLALRRLCSVVAAACIAVAIAASSQAAAEENRDYEELELSLATHAPRPEYPYEARRLGLTGSGIVKIEVDPESGRVTSARMDPSTGHAILDKAATDAFRLWRFKPGLVRRVRSPITFTTTGTPFYRLDVKAKSTDEVLAAFLGKGTVLRGSFPAYPRSVEWTPKQGSGVYELHVQKDGSVGQVKVLKSSGDQTFDEVTVKTLRKWKLRRGPLIIELPLSFTLGPTSYSVDIPKRR